jgi:hypothetical protein
MIGAITGQWVKGARNRPADHPFQPHLRRDRDRRHASTPANARSRSRTSSISPIHRRHLLCPHGRGRGQGEPVLPGPRRPWLPAAVSFAAGLFVQPDPGPVLANTGLNALSFRSPSAPAMRISVRLTARRKTRRTDSLWRGPLARRRFTTRTANRWPNTSFDHGACDHGKARPPRPDRLRHAAARPGGPTARSAGRPPRRCPPSGRARRSP